MAAIVRGDGIITDKITSPSIDLNSSPQTPQTMEEFTLQNGDTTPNKPFVIGGDTDDPVIGNGTSDTGNVNPTNSGVTSTSPFLNPSDPTNLNSLWQYIMSMFFSSPNNPLGNIFNGNFTGDGFSYLTILQNIGQGIKDVIDKLDLDGKNDGPQLALVEKAADVAQSYIDILFNQIMSYQSWYLQQEYNSPLNQLKRLEAAGLSSAFIFGNYNNTAGQPANTAVGAIQRQQSGAGEISAQLAAADKQKWASIFGASIDAVASMTKAGIDSVKTLAEADNIRKLTPLQVAHAMQQFKNLGVTENYLKSQVNTLNTTNVEKLFEMDKKAYDTVLGAAKTQLDNAQTDINNARVNAPNMMGNYWLEEEVYKGKAKDEKGNYKDVYLTHEQLVDADKHGGRINNNLTIADYHEVGGYIKGGASAEAKGGIITDFYGIQGKGWLEGGVNGKFASTHTESKGTERYTEESEINTSGRSNEYENTQTVSIGGTSWTKVTQRKLVHSKEYIDYMSNLQDRLNFAKNHYNELSTGERARAFTSLDNWLTNYSNLLPRVLGNQFRAGLLQDSTTKTLIGD